jgi:quercetin dioxygenase-like cupin family protein
VVVEVFTGKPYNDILNEGYFIRNFDNLLNSDELIWHRDKKNREVTVLEGNNWKFQYDNCLPFVLFKGDTIRVPAEIYHRLIKGTTALSLKIKEIEE